MRVPRRGWFALLGAVVLLVGASALAVLVAGAPAAVAQGGAVGVGTDPLTPAEEQAALDALAATRAGAAAMRSADAAGLTAPAEELLLVERHSPEKGEVAAAGGAPPRRADLFLYRYADDVLVHAVYDYASGQTVVVEEVQGVQLPLTQAERDLATRIAFADPALLAFLQDEHRQIVGEELTSAAQVDVRAFVYHAGAAPEIEPPEAQACGVQRCAQLLILTENNVTFSILPIVNLSTLRTASVIPLAVDGAAPAPAAHQHTEGAQP